MAAITRMGEAIMAKELVPIVLAIVFWGHQPARKGVLVKSDNLSIVTAINKGSCREAVVMHLLWCMRFFVTHFDIKLVVAEQLPGKDNTIANLLSRKILTLARKICAGLLEWPTLVPAFILHIISPEGPDWVFCKLLKETLLLAD